jgi:tetraacyldisaccharide 4'-kinase
MDTVDIIVVSRQPGGAGGIATPATSVVPVYETTLGNEQFVNLTTGRQVDPVDAKAIFTGARVHAIAGTGHPQRFFAHLVSLGLVVTRTQAFPDHHNYRAADMPGTDAEVILMTEKDAVKCDLFADERMWFMRVDAQLPEPFTDFILNKLSAWKA